MFCKFCGSQTDNRNGICNACFRDFTATVAPAAPAPSQDYIPVTPTVPQYPQAYIPNTAPEEKPKGGRMYGFGMALTSVLLFFVFLIAIGICNVAPMFIIPAIAVLIVSFIFSLISISRFGHCKRTGAPRPIATLILGIHGLVLSGLMLFYMNIIFLGTLFGMAWF